MRSAASSTYSSAKASPRQHSSNSGNRQPPRGGNGRRQGPVKQYIPLDRFIRKATPVTMEAYVSSTTFADFGLHTQLYNNIVHKGYDSPTAIQDQTIRSSLEGHDVVGLANTGTGKTAAFAIPVIQKLLNEPNSRALIMAPTRELAVQIDEEFRSLCRGTRLHSVIIIGGANMRPQIRALQSNPRIVIGTPGRLKDHVQEGTLRLGSTNLIVLDEVDRMLDMGFVRDIRALLARVAPVRQSLFFSATMESSINALIGDFSKDPVRVSVVHGETSDNVDQNVVMYQAESEKIDRLHDVLIGDNTGKVLVFEDTKHGVERLGKLLMERGFKVDTLHGNKSQAQRQRALTRFKAGEVRILVATDVAARGIDVADISHVINFSTPTTWSDYIHRIGRAGRAGKTGIALTFVPHPGGSYNSERYGKGSRIGA